MYPKWEAIQTAKHAAPAESWTKMFDYLARALDISLNIEFEHLAILLKTNNAIVSLLMYASESDYFSCGDCWNFDPIFISFFLLVGWSTFSRLLSTPLWLRSIFFLDRFQIDSDGIVRTITSGLPENRVFNLKVKAKETGRYIVLQWRWLLCLSVFHITNQIDVFDEMPFSRLSLMGNALKVLTSFSAGLYCHRKNIFLYSAS